MIKGMDIVIIGIQPWDIEIGSNCKNIASQFAKHNRVLYVNPPLDRVTRFKQRNSDRIKKRIDVSKGIQPDLIRLEDNLWNLYPKDIVESVNWIGSQRIFRKLNERNSRILSKNIRSAIKRLNFKNYILFNDSSMFLGKHMKELLRPALYTYYMRDFLINVPYWRKHGKDMEPELMKEVDLIVNNSEYYTEYCSQFNTNSVMVGQGCDLELFDDKEGALKIPKDLKQIKGPIIGYVGSLTTLRLDIDILEHIASQRSDWNLVLVGPEDENFKRSRLHELTNVHFLGNKNSKDLPAYIKGFDVTINPQIVNDITIGNYPRKIDEYLALGKPVVATHTKAMEMFKDFVYLGDSKEDYVLLIEKALSEIPEQEIDRRIKFAKSHSWENNVQAIYEAIDKSFKEKIYAIS